MLLYKTFLNNRKTAPTINITSIISINGGILDRIDKIVSGEI